MQVDLQLSKAYAKFDKEKAYLEDCLREKLDKITHLEVKLDDLMEDRRRVEAQLQPEVRNLTERCQMLENQTETNMMKYQETFSELSELRINYNSLLKQDQRKEEKISQLNRKNNRLTERNNVLIENMKALRELYVQMQQRTETSVGTSSLGSTQQAQSLGQRAKITIRGGKTKDSTAGEQQNIFKQ